MKKKVGNSILSFGKKYFYLAAFMLIALSLTFGIYANVNKTTKWQNSNEVYVSVSGFQVTLQDAINSGLLKGSSNAVGNISNVQNPGHSFDQIWVSVNGEEMTLKQALAGNGLCGTSSPSTSYSSQPFVGHYATEIEVTVDGAVKSLQDAINDGSVGKTDGGWTEWSECSNGLKSRTCTNPAPGCGGSDCIGEATSAEGCGLINGMHTSQECVTGGGEVVSLSEGGICRFNMSSCPGGWTQYQNWRTTTPNTGCATLVYIYNSYTGSNHPYVIATSGTYGISCDYGTSPCCGSNPGYIPTSGSDWSNHAPNRNYWSQGYNPCGVACGSEHCSSTTAYCDATTTQIGCY